MDVEDMIRARDQTLDTAAVRCEVSQRPGDAQLNLCMILHGMRDHSFSLFKSI